MQTVDAWLETIREAEKGIDPMCWVQKDGVAKGAEIL